MAVVLLEAEAVAAVAMAVGVAAEYPGARGAEAQRGR